MPRLTLILLLATTATAAGCQQEQPDGDAINGSEPVLNLPSVPRPEPAIDRASLLAAAAEAASATAAGAEAPASLRSLDGRQFELRIRFGCRGPSNDLEERWLGWSFDPAARRIRVRAMPTISKDVPLVARITGDRFEAVEGFWIPRPWLLQPICPAAAAVQAVQAQPQTQAGADDRQQRQPERAEAQQARRQPSAAGGSGEEEERAEVEPVPTPPRIGIAQFFTDEDSRTRRRDMRPYQAGQTLAEGKAISSQGYNLVLSGRLRALPGAGVIQCSARNPDSPPECIISAEFLRVWIEQPGTGEVIAEWGGS